MATTGTTVTAAYDRLAEAAAGDIRVMLLDDSLTLDASIEFVDDVSSAEISGATNYARKVVTGETYTAASGELTGTVPTWTALGTAETVKYAVAFVHTGSDATAWIISYLTADPSATLNGGDFTVTFTDDIIASYGTSTPDTIQAWQSAAGSGGYGALAYYKDRERVWLGSSLAGGTSGTTGHTLPSGYRPAADVELPVLCSDGSTGRTTGFVAVTTAGVVTFDFATGYSTLIVEGLSFRAA